MADNYHGINYYVTNITISRTGLINTSTSSIDKFWSIHGIGQLIGWNLLVFFGYVSARFLKQYPWWIILHLIGATIPSLFSVGVSIVAIYKSNFLLLKLIYF